MIDIRNTSLLKITRVKPWAICFDYDGKHYLLHGNYEIGEGQWQELYERELNFYGTYKLKRIAERSGKERVADDYKYGKIKSLDIDNLVKEMVGDAE